MNQISVSIIIPNYNHSHFIAKAISHAVSQTLAPIEVLIIDDCSTDDSLTVINEFASKFPLIRVISNPVNKGIIFNLNNGLQQAKGTHVIFAAADDWIKTTLVEQATKQLSAHPDCALWSSGSWIVYEEEPDKLLPAKMITPVSVDSYFSPAKSQELIKKIDSWFMGNTTVYNRKLLLDKGGFDPKLQSFTDGFVSKVLAAEHGCCFSPEKFGTWRIRKTSYANTYNVDTTRQLAVIESVCALLNNDYRNLFDAVTRERIELRMKSNLARTMWSVNGGKVTPSLAQLLNDCMQNSFLSTCNLLFLKLISFIPKYNNLLGQAFLYAILRPFDVMQRIKI